MMKKKLTALCLAILLFLLLPVASSNTSAAELRTKSLISRTTTQLENGDSIVVELTAPVHNNAISTYSTLKTTSGSKTVTYLTSKKKVLWSFTLSANFTYNGSNAVCTSASTSNQVNDSAWKLSDITLSRSYNVAKASVTAKEYFLFVPFNTVTENLQLKCSATGTLS